MFENIYYKNKKYTYIYVYVKYWKIIEDIYKERISCERTDIAPETYTQTNVKQT